MGYCPRCAKCCSRCCACATLTKILATACVLALIPAAYLSYELYLKPWAEEQLASAPSFRNDALSCAACVGVNRAFPVAVGTASGFSSFEAHLANNGGRVVSALVFAGVAVGGSSLLFVLVSALSSSSSSASAVFSSSSSSNNNSNSVGFDALLMLAHGQFITLLGSLQLRGAPLFYLEFCRKLAWTNLQLFFPQEASLASPTLAARALRAAANDSDPSAVHGVQRYAQLVGVDPDHLFRYTCLAVVVACTVVVALYVLIRGCVRLCKSDHAGATEFLDTRVIWTVILLLSMLQYILSMTSSFEIYDSLTSKQLPRSTSTLVLPLVVLFGACVGFVAFGVLKVTQHRHELDDLGTDAHECKPVKRKYGAYYEDFSKENALFFVAKLGLEIVSGAVVGIVQDPMTQIGVLVALNASFLVLTILRDPFLVRLFYYVSILSGNLRVILLLLSAAQASPDTFPQSARDLAAEIIIGLNVLLLACLLVRQVYGVTTALCKWCRETSNINFRASASSSSFTQSRSGGSGGSGDNTWSSHQRSAKGGSSRRRGGDYEPRFTLQQLIAAKIREDSPAVTPPMHGTPPPSREPYQGNPSHRFV